MQCPGKLLAALEALRSGLGHRAIDDNFQLCVQVGTQFANGSLARVAYGEQKLNLSGSGKGGLQRQHLVHQRAQREQIRATVELAPHRLFRGHVLDLALDHSGLGLRARARRLRDAKVAQLDVPVIRKQNVRRRHVPMYDI